VKLDCIYLFLKPSNKASERFPFDYLMSINIDSTLIPLDIVLGTVFL